MKLKVVKDYQAMSRAAADLIIEKIRNDSELTFGLATGGTPEGTYKNLIKDHRLNGTSYASAKTFNLDEYIGIPINDPNSYRFYMNTHLFDHIDIKKSNTFVPRGNIENPTAECERYEDLLNGHGGVDLQLLGIGRNGHIGFNEPGTSFFSKTHVVSLAATTREANSRYFPSLEDVPKQAITMGIGTIMKSKEILLLISGERKREAVKRLLTGEVNESFPASILNQHPNVTVIVDHAASALIDPHLFL